MGVTIRQRSQPAFLGALASASLTTKFTGTDFRVSWEVS